MSKAGVEQRQAAALRLVLDRVQAGKVDVELVTAMMTLSGSALHVAFASMHREIEMAKKRMVHGN